ncbi:MAG: 23S rRNA (uracil(1939)-C(5))-methyltransferase RlmD [Planctomycetota bacterium]
MMAKRRRFRKKARNPAERRLLDELGAGRPLAVPDCAHQSDCGGCTWQRIPYRRQLEWKDETIREAYRAADWGEIALEGVLASPKAFGYRNHMEFSFSARRWLTRAEIARGAEEERDFALGLHVPGGVGRVMRIDRCSLQVPGANRVLRALQEFAAGSGRGAWRHREHTGFWRFARIRHAVGTDAILLGVVTAERDEAVMTALAEHLERSGVALSVLANGVTDRPADTSEGATWYVDRGAGTIVERIDGLEFELSAETFFQPNSHTAGRVFGLAAEMAGARGDERVLDLFSGTGTLSLFLARRAKEVRGLELVPASVECARRNAARNGIGNADFEVVDLLRGVPDEERTRGYDVVVSDPPRAGMHPKALRAILEMAPPRFVSVGCNPVTQARDLAVLVREGGYRVTRMVGVDQFPQTPHVECLVALERG